MTSIGAAHEIESLAEQYIENFGIKTHKDLKRVGEFKSLPENSQRKIYDKVRYRTKKANLRLVENSNSIAENKLIKNNLQKNDKFKKIPSYILLVLIFSFLASESFKFYEQFEIVPFFKYSIPFIIESSILLLAIKNTKLASAILCALVLFNISSFSYKTIETDRNLNFERITKTNKISFLKNEKMRNENEIKTLINDKRGMEKRFNDLVSSGYLKIANTAFSERIMKNTNEISNLKIKLENLDQEILNEGAVRESHHLLANDTLFMIALKVILQFTFLYLVLDVKKSIIKKGENQ